jgi:MFS family permease
MLSWFRSLTGIERRTLTACFGGWALDAFDGQIYSFTIPTLVGIWGISYGQAGLLGSATLIASAFGGWFVGTLCDRFGRLRMLQITILWYAIFTFLSGFTNNFGQLLICRTLQGLGYGGEWAAGAVLIGEVIRSEYRGRALGIVQSGFAVGWGAAALLYPLVFAVIPAEYAWRILFWIGLLPALLVFWIRRHVRESPRFLESRRRGRRIGGLARLLSIFAPRYVATTIKVGLFTVGAHGGYNAVAVWLPTYLKTERGLSVMGTGSFLLVVILGAFCGFVAGAYLADRIGRKGTFMTSAVGAAIAAVLYTQLPVSTDVIPVLGFLFGLFASLGFAPMGAFMAEMYPTEVRGTGQGFCYNVGRGLGALFPALVGFFSAKMSLGLAISVLSVSAYGLMVCVLLTLPETRGRVLDTISRGPADELS